MEQYGTTQLIFISAIGASNKSNSKFLREKYQAEQLLINSNIKSKVILRLAPVLHKEQKNDPVSMGLRKAYAFLAFASFPIQKNK